MRVLHVITNLFFWTLHNSLTSMKHDCLQVYGLDINPRAVKVARINLYLNALDDHGQPVYDAEMKTLLDRVEFHESDLLSYCRDHSIELDRIVGCIPQVLSKFLVPCYIYQPYRVPLWPACYFMVTK